MKLKIAAAFLVLVLTFEIVILVLLIASPTHVRPVQEWPKVENDRPLLTPAQQEELDTYGRVGLDRGDGRVWIITKLSNARENVRPDGYLIVIEKKANDIKDAEDESK